MFLELVWDVPDEEVVHILYVDNFMRITRHCCCNNLRCAWPSGFEGFYSQVVNYTVIRNSSHLRYIVKIIMLVETRRGKRDIKSNTRVVQVNKENFPVSYED